MCTCSFDPNSEKKGGLSGAAQAVGTHRALHELVREQEQAPGVLLGCS